MIRLSMAERLGMAEARGARLESRVLKQDAVIEALNAKVALLEAAMKGISHPPAKPKDVDIEENPAMLASVLSAAKMSEIAARVALTRDMTVVELRGPSQLAHISRPRQEAMLIMHEAGYSMPRIGRFFHRDHTTVLHGIRAAKARSGNAPE
ncbi:MAG: helix-turn-helix domain-containing protein [Candidatus Pacebacteria bacterium]|nr:helix-turn-helix domain-containing protein [Candidatus Paceibacterota bacterium]